MQKQPKIEILRHSLSHILAAAVFEMFPDARFGMGPAVENGFYYDFDLPRTLIPEDLAILEGKMRNIIQANHKFERANLSIAEAVKDFKKAAQPLKTEIIKDIAKENPKAKTVSIYRTGNFVDLCSGPHIESTGEISPKAFKLTKISGAYWKGDEKNKMLQRIYGVAFATDKELRQYLAMMQEAEKRDHRKLGKELDLFSFHDIAPGMPFFHPKGTIIYDELKNFWIDAQQEFNYNMILCPSMLDIAVWKKSGHWDHYRDDMYFTETEKGERKFGLRPMDCPGAITIFNNSLKSYRDLPLRYSEPGLITRKEKSGQLGGLFRVQQFTQDDAHIFLAEDQIEEEIFNVMKLVDKIYKPFGFKYKAFLSTRPDDFMGDIKSWNKAETALKKVLGKVFGKKYGSKEKDGAFYGPKIDFELKDAIGRTWQCATIQLDFQMPLKFDCKYIDTKGKENFPVIIHRTIMGSFERFMGIVLEHYAGAFPLWLSPVQIEIIPVSEKFEKYGKDIFKMLQGKNIRVVMNEASESLGKRIRTAQNQKVNYMLIVGEKEMKAKSVAVRDREKGDLGAMKIEKFLEKIEADISQKK